MSIKLTLVHTTKIEKLTYSESALCLGKTALADYLIDHAHATALTKNQKLVYSTDLESKDVTRKDKYGDVLTYIHTSSLKNIPKEILEGKKEKHVRKALEYLKCLDGYIILWFT